MNAKRLNTSGPNKNTLDLQVYIDAAPELARYAGNVAKSLAGLGLHKPALIINNAIETMKIIRCLFNARSNEVFISVSGGVASIDKCPDHITVYIHDTDIPYCEVCGSNDVTLVCHNCLTYFCDDCGTLGARCQCADSVLGEYK